MAGVIVTLVCLVFQNASGWIVDLFIKKPA